MSSITHHTLDNGLQLILKEVHSAPVITWSVMYRIGSRNERSGQTGISHWVEHMMFKGTEKYPPGTFERMMDRAGGRWNAFTSMDYTLYYETLPADRIELALEAEADRMMNTRFEEEETESERTVIISERHGLENNPSFWLREELQAAAFRVHGYHHEIIGDMADLDTITRDDLMTHYQQHYKPSNATIIAVGAFQTDEMLRLIHRHYGGLNGDGQPHSLFVRPEPPQQGERRVIVERPGNTAFLKAAYRAPAATHEDWFRLDVLDSVLTGPGGGLDNKTSRLYQALVKSGIAAGIGGGMVESIDPYLYGITVVLQDGRSIEDAEAVLFQEIDRVHQDGITQAELDKAIKQARAAVAYSMESITEQNYWLAQSAALGEIEWADRYMSRLEAVTLDDIRDVAHRYLIPRNRTVGWLVPTGMEDDES